VGFYLRLRNPGFRTPTAYSNHWVPGDSNPSLKLSAEPLLPAWLGAVVAVVTGVVAPTDTSADMAKATRSRSIVLLEEEEVFLWGLAVDDLKTKRMGVRCRASIVLQSVHQSDV